MFIDEALRISDTECPNPYHAFEKYAWCDELSSQLMMKYTPQFERCLLHACSGGAYLLPEHVTLSMVDRILYSGREILKQDFRTYGISYVQSGGRGRIALRQGLTGASPLEVIFIRPYEKIRYVHLEGETVEFGDNCFFLEANPFRAGDILKITTGNTVYEDVYVMDVVPHNGPFEAIRLSACGMVPGTHTTDILRRVTETTCCPPPYDAMYVDFINAKISLYQRDYSSYDVHMALFNIKLNDYAYWLKQQENRDSGISISNWW